MAVAYLNNTASHAADAGSVSEASFTWNHAPGGTAKGVVVFVFQEGATSDACTGVTYGGVTLASLGTIVADTASELGTVKAYFLGASVPTDNPAAVVISRTNDTTQMYAVCYTFSSAADCSTAGYATWAENQSFGVQSIDDGSPGENSVRVMGMYYGDSSVRAAGTGSTAGASIDLGARVACTFYETTPGQGSRDVGPESSASDDLAAIAFAVIEDSGSGTDDLTADNIESAASVTQPAIGQTHTLAADSLQSATSVSQPILVSGAVYLSPQAPSPAGGWTNELGTTTNLHTHIDELVADDDDYIRSSLQPVDDIIRFPLSNGSPSPTSSDTQRVRYRYGKDAANSHVQSLTVRLIEGASTVIATWLHPSVPATVTAADQVLTSEQKAAITDYDDLSIEFEAGGVVGYDDQVAARPNTSTPDINAAYSQFESIAYAGALGLNQQGGLPHPYTTAPDAVSGLTVEYGDGTFRCDFYPQGMRSHVPGYLMIPTDWAWDRGEGTLIFLYEHVDGEESPLSDAPVVFNFNDGDTNYELEMRDSETTRRLRMGGTAEGTTQLTWTGLPNNWDGGVHIEILSWSQTDSYLMIDGINYGSKGGLSNAGTNIPTTVTSNVEVLQTGTPRVIYIYSMMSTAFMDSALAEQLSANIFDWAV